jgi:hypothetical protein
MDDEDYIERVGPTVYPDWCFPIYASQLSSTPIKNVTSMEELIFRSKRMENLIAIQQTKLAEFESWKAAMTAWQQTVNDALNDYIQWRATTNAWMTETDAWIAEVKPWKLYIEQCGVKVLNTNESGSYVNKRQHVSRMLETLLHGTSFFYWLGNGLHYNPNVNQQIGRYVGDQKT